MTKAAAASLEKIVKDVIKKLGGKDLLTEEDVKKAWEDAAGRKAARHTKPVSIRRAVLLVNVDTSAWLYELTTEKKEILKNLEGKLKGKALKGLRFRIGNIK